MYQCIFCNNYHNLSSKCGNYKHDYILSKYLSQYLELNTNVLLDEIKIIKKSVQQLKCDSCGILFKSKQNLQYHVKKEVCAREKQKYKEFECKKCNKIFSEKRNLQYHINNSVCNKESKNVTTNITNQQNVQNLVNNIANTSNINNQQNIQTQNNTNNNIQINVNTNEPRKSIEMLPFRDASYKISTKKYLEYANNPEQAIRKFVKDEHLNPNKPERMNVLNTNPRSNRVQLFDYDEDFVCRWQTKDKNDISELLFDRGVNILFFAKIMLASAGVKLDPKKETKLNARIKEYENDEKLKKKYIDMISDLTYDYREMIGTNKKLIDQETQLLKNC